MEALTKRSRNILSEFIGRTSAGITQHLALSKTLATEGMKTTCSIPLSYRVTS
jgi:hypothetical protein